jgi:polyisoprenoid-binding protein YceI
MATLLAIPVFVIPACAADFSFEMKPETTKVQWTLSDVLHTVHGTFKLKSGRIDFDTDTGKASGQVVVDVASGESGSEARDSRMHANVLETKKFPEAVFAPNRVEGTLALPGTSTVKVHGAFTIHGSTHEIAIDVQVTAAPDQLRTAMSFDIPYVAWGMKDPSNFVLKVNKTVQMSIEADGPLQRH